MKAKHRFAVIVTSRQECDHHCFLITLRPSYNMVKSIDKYEPIIKVHDILVHTPTIEAQHIYRVIAIRLGGLGEDGLVELEPLGMSSHSRIMIPHLMLDCMILNGIIDNVCGLPNAKDDGAGAYHGEVIMCRAWRKSYSLAAAPC